jgi:hypothetical protein
MAALAGQNHIPDKKRWHSIHCQKGAWTEAALVCTIVHCGFPSYTTALQEDALVQTVDRELLLKTGEKSKLGNINMLAKG